jgi:hypothetical protein
MVSQRSGSVARPCPMRSRASTIPQTSTQASATNIRDRLVLKPSSTPGKLALKCSQLKKVSRNWSTGALARRQPSMTFTAAWSAKYFLNSCST